MMKSGFQARSAGDHRNREIHENGSLLRGEDWVECINASPKYAGSNNFDE